MGEAGAVEHATADAVPTPDLRHRRQGLARFLTTTHLDG